MIKLKLDSGMSALILMLLLQTSSYAQDKTVMMNIGKKSTIQRVSYIADSGFVIFSNHAQKYGVIGHMKSWNDQIAYYDKKLNNVWTYFPEKDEWERFFVSSNESDMIYWMDYADDYDAGAHSPKPTQIKRITFTRINHEGKGERFAFKVKETSANVDLLAVCTDENNMYVMSRKIPDENHIRRPIENDEITLYKIGHTASKLEHKKVKIDLNKGGAISFLGIRDGLMYFSQQRYISDNKLEIEIYTTDTEGEFIESFTIKPKIDGFFRKHNYIRDLHGAYTRFPNSFYVGSTTVETANILGAVYFNFDREEIYFNTFTEKSVDCSAKDCRKYLFQTYDFEGKKINEYEKTLYDIFRKEPEYTESLTLRYSSSLKPLDSVSMKLLMAAYNSTGVIILDKDKIKDKAVFGKTYTINFIEGNVMDMCDNLAADISYAPQSYVDYLNTIKKGKVIKGKYFAFNMGKTYVLAKFINSRKSNQIELMLFE